MSFNYNKILNPNYQRDTSLKSGHHEINVTNEVYLPLVESSMFAPLPNLPFYDETYNHACLCPVIVQRSSI